MKIAGTPVFDATKAVKIKITARDVSLGDTKDPGACAAARACLRELHAEQARVHIGRTYLKVGGKWMRFLTSKPLRSEIIAFDRGGKFEPGEYMLSPMHPAARASAGKRQGSNSNRRTGKKRAKPHVVTGIRAHGANR